MTAAPAPAVQNIFAFLVLWFIVATHIETENPKKSDQIGEHVENDVII